MTEKEREYLKEKFPSVIFCEAVHFKNAHIEGIHNTATGENAVMDYSRTKVPERKYNWYEKLMRLIS